MSQPLLSILMPTMVSRQKYCDRILSELSWQKSFLENPDDVEILVAGDDGKVPTGTKRTDLIQMASGLYIAFVDDDDMVTDVYLKKQLDVARSGMDCGSLKGLYFLNGKYDRPFLHSIEYTSWWQDDKYYYRTPNHLNAVKRELILDIPYENITVGEDGRWSEAVQKAGVLKTEYRIEETLYLYYDKSKLPGQ